MWRFCVFYFFLPFSFLLYTSLVFFSWSPLIALHLKPHSCWCNVSLFFFSPFFATWCNTSSLFQDHILDLLVQTPYIHFSFNRIKYILYVRRIIFHFFNFIFLNCTSLSLKKKMQQDRSYLDCLSSNVEFVLLSCVLIYLIYVCMQIFVVIGFHTYLTSNKSVYFYL